MKTQKNAFGYMFIGVKTKLEKKPIYPLDSILQ